MPKHSLFSHSSQKQLISIYSAKHLTLARVLVLVRTCINHLHTPSLQQQLFASGSLRSAPSEREAKEKIAEILEVLNSKKALTRGLTELFRTEPYQDINLIFKILKNFLSEAHVLYEINYPTPLATYLAIEPTEKDETLSSESEAHPIEQSIDRLIATNDDTDRLIAECVHELIHFATEAFIAQNSAKSDGKQDFLDEDGVGRLFGPIINSLLVRKTDDVNCMTRINGLIASAIRRHRKEAEKTDGAMKNFKARYPGAYTENTKLLLTEINYAELQKLQQKFKSLFVKILPEFIASIKRNSVRAQQAVVLTNTHLTHREREKIMQILDSGLGTETKYSAQLNELKSIYKNICDFNQLLTDLNGGNDDLKMIESEIEGMEYFEKTKIIPESHTISKIFPPQEPEASEFCEGEALCEGFAP